MKYYSEILKAFYNTPEECTNAEQKHLSKENEKALEKAKKAEERKARAKDVEAAYEAFIKAKDKYEKALTDFVKDFGSFHMTIKEPNGTSTYDIFEKLFTL